MTKAELIKALDGVPDDAVVKVWEQDGDEDGFGRWIAITEVNRVKIFNEVLLS